MWKKKNSAFSQISPKKEDQNNFSVAAKVFNFSLNPVQCAFHHGLGLTINSV